MFNEEKFEYYDLYCKTCKFKDFDEIEEPCNHCLLFCVDADSQKPVNYVERCNN